jgi:hypothetical protein
MKDEYDFSGATRGKFFRPGAKVKLPYHRNSQSWLVDVATTGRWWQPEFWRDPEYLAASPWPEERVEAAFQALITIYTPDVAKAAFKWVLIKDPAARTAAMDSIWRLLADPMIPESSALLRLGLDLIEGSALQNSAIVHGLRSTQPDQFAHARFLCRCLAAFSTAGIKAVAHPSHASGTQPDLHITLPGGSLFVDVKRSGESDRIKEEQAWFWKLATAHRGSEVDAQITLTAKYEQLQSTEDGRAFLRANIDRIASELADLKERLAQEGSSFPSSDSIDGLVDVKVLGVTRRGAGSSFMGVPTDGHREVSRIVRSAITQGALRLPPNEPGIVCLDPGTHAPSYLLVDELHRWLATHGAEFPHLVGVLIAVESFVEPVPGMIGRMEQLVPIWRESVEGWISNGPWNQVSRAFASHDLEVLAHKIGKQPYPAHEAIAG